MGWVEVFIVVTGHVGKAVSNQDRVRTFAMRQISIGDGDHFIFAFARR